MAIMSVKTGKGDRKSLDWGQAAREAGIRLHERLGLGCTRGWE